MRAFFRHFVARPDDERPFFERMTVRIAPNEPLTDPTAGYTDPVGCAGRALAAVARQALRRA